MVTIQTGLHYKPYALRRIFQHTFSKVHDSLCVQSTDSWSSTNTSSFLLNILLLRWKPFSQGGSSAQQIMAGRRLLPFLVPSFHPRPHQPFHIYKSNNKPCIIISMYIDRQSNIHLLQLKRTKCGYFFIRHLFQFVRLPTPAIPRYLNY